MPSTPARRNLTEAFNSVASPARKRVKMTTPQSASMKMHRSMLKKSETKFHKLSGKYSAATRFKAFDIISALESGNNNVSRIGNKIKVTKIEVRAYSDGTTPVRIQLGKCNNILTLPTEHASEDKQYVETLNHNNYWTITDHTEFRGTTNQFISFTKNFSLGTNITFDNTTSIENLLFITVTKSPTTTVWWETKVHFKE